MKLLVLAALFALACAKHEKFIGWKSYYVGPSTVDQVKALHTLSAKLELDFLSAVRVESEGVVLVQPQHQEEFISSLENLGISYRTHADDVKAQLDRDDENIESWTRSSTRIGGQSRPYNNYQRMAVIDSYMRDIAARFPRTVTLVTAGRSFEGHPVNYLKISTTNFRDTSKPVILIDGGIHSRDWISPPTVTWAINKLTENVTDPDLLNNFDWILLPVVNPDGYEFSFTNNRFWSKTRSTDTDFVSNMCPGVDANRNYDFFWNTVGTSNSPCSDIYAGNRPFSEVETTYVRDILHEHLPRMALYLTMHSYGSMILYPWGHDGSMPSNAFGLHTVGVAMANAIDNLSLPNFPRYTVGNSAWVRFYAAAGASEDYAHSIGVPLSYAYDLPGLSAGYQGFHLEPQYIEQVCRETWAGIAVGVRRAGEMFRKLLD